MIEAVDGAHGTTTTRKTTTRATSSVTQAEPPGVRKRGRASKAALAALRRARGTPSWAPARAARGAWCASPFPETTAQAGVRHRQPQGAQRARSTAQRRPSRWAADGGGAMDVPDGREALELILAAPRRPTSRTPRDARGRAARLAVSRASPRSRQGSRVAAGRRPARQRRGRPFAARPVVLPRRRGRRHHRCGASAIARGHRRAQAGQRGAAGGAQGLRRRRGGRNARFAEQRAASQHWPERRRRCKYPDALAAVENAASSRRSRASA